MRDHALTTESVRILVDTGAFPFRASFDLDTFATAVADPHSAGGQELRT